MEAIKIIEAIREEFHRRVDNINIWDSHERERIKLEFEGAVGDALSRLMDERGKGVKNGDDEG